MKENSALPRLHDVGLGNALVLPLVSLLPSSASPLDGDFWAKTYRHESATIMQ
jgi:hypothetical protein